MELVEADGESAVPRSVHLRELAARLRFRLLFIALIFVLIALGLIFGSFTAAADRWFPDSVIFLSRQLAIGLLVAATATAFIPLIVPSKKLNETLVRWLQDDVRAAIHKQTKKIEDQTRELFEAASSLDAIQKVGINRVYASRGEADADMSVDLSRPDVKTIRVLGVSLNDLMGRNAPLRATWERLHDYLTRSGGRKIDVRILLVDPHSLGAELRAEAEGAYAYAAGSLKDDVQTAAEALKEFNDVRQENDRISFAFRLYRVTPQLFLCQTDTVSYVQPYYFWRQRDNPTLLPLVRCVGDAVLLDLRNHFDLIWNCASVSAAEFLDGHAVGLDEGAYSSGMVSIFSHDAAPRLKWVIDQAAASVRGPDGDRSLLEDLAVGQKEPRRLWLQGISLRSYFDDQSRADLYESMRNMIDTKAEVRILLLHPYSEQAYYRSYREQRLMYPSSTLSFEDYCRQDDPHEGSKLVQDTKRTINEIFRVQDMGKKNLQVRLYSSAPFCFMLLTDDRAMVEQYHYGKLGHEDSIAGGRILGKDMPVIEYRKRSSERPARWNYQSRFDLLENHFDFVWEKVSITAEPEDLSPVTGRRRGHFGAIAGRRPPSRRRRAAERGG